MSSSLELASRSFTPPRDGICFINRLPSELLSRIFELGFELDETNAAAADEDEGTIDSSDFLRLLDRAGGQDPCGDDVGEPWEDDGCGADGNDNESMMIAREEHESKEDQDQADSDTAVSSHSHHTFQILVSDVCRHWRDVAFSTPSLWTNFGFRAGDPFESGLRQLELCRTLPMNIWICCELDQTEDDAAALSGVNTRSLFSFSEHYAVYEFSLAVSDPSVFVVTQLTTLELFYTGALDELDDIVQPGTLQHLTLFSRPAPLLTTLKLWGVSVNWDQPWISSAPNLKNLILAYHTENVRPSWAQFTIILRGAFALEKLTLNHSGPSGHPMQWSIEPTLGSPADLNAPIRLLQLTDLTLVHHPQEWVVGLLRMIHLPALKNLVLRFIGDCTDFIHELANPATSFPPVREQSPSLLNKLEDLKLAGLVCTDECVEMLYGELHNLRRLRLTLEVVPPLFFDILGTCCTLAGRGGIWLPRLEMLYVSGRSTHDLREVVQKRMDIGAPLRVLYVETCEADYEDVEWLMENVETLKFAKCVEQDSDDASVI